MLFGGGCGAGAKLGGRLRLEARSVTGGVLDPRLIKAEPCCFGSCLIPVTSLTDAVGSLRALNRNGDVPSC
ncbi:hypothetical protein GCM10017750_40550 [Streptomyces racemochromogenes]